MSAILTSAFIKMQGEKFVQSQVLAEIDVVTEHFRLVTSNLMNQYNVASQAVVDFF